MSLKIGADPEVFIKNKVLGQYVSAHDLLPGTKHSPFPTAFGGCQVDGVAGEFNIKPAKNATDFSNRVRECLNFINQTVKGHSNDLVVAIEPVAWFDGKYFKSLPRTAKELGCEPDFDAYSGTQNIKPATPDPFRTAAGHLHLGWSDGIDPQDPEHTVMCHDVVKQLDVALFVPSLHFDRNTQRRRLYGRPGSYRPKFYGVEYRVLSNRWLKNEHLCRWVFNRSLKAYNDLQKGKKYFETIDHEHVQWFFDNAERDDLGTRLKNLSKAYPELIQLPKVI